MKARIALACCLVLFGSAASPFSDGFEANALEPSDIKAISIDAATPIPVQNVKVDAAGLLTAVKVGPPVPPQPVCKPLPAGVRVHRLPWERIFVGQRWPNPTSWSQPIGSFTLRSGNGQWRQGKPITGQVITSPFVLDNADHQLDWRNAQPVDYGAGYNPAQGANSITVAISPCPGDLYAACKNTAKTSRVNYGPTVAGACRFAPGTALWATWHFLPPNLDPKANTCMPQNASGGVKCDANFGSR